MKRIFFILTISLIFSSYKIDLAKVAKSPSECFDAADIMARELNFITGGTMSHEYEYNIFVGLYNVCISQ